MKRHDGKQRNIYDEYLERDFTDAPESEGLALPLDRRQFLQLAGGGIAVAFCIPGSLLAQQRGRRGGEGQQLPEDFNAFLRIGEDGRVTGFTGKVELGQGIITSLAQMLADELDVPLESVDMVMGDTDLCPWDRGTFGSMTTRFFGPPFRAAAAEAKAVLVELAAEKLGVTKDRLKTRDGAVYDDAGQKKVTYAELAKGKKILRHLKGAPVEKPGEFTLVGKGLDRRDAVEKVTGRAKYAGDIREPGMLCARILRPPSHDAKFLRVDTSAAREVAGTQVVQDGDLIAVLHESPDLAEQALARLKPEYDQPAASVDDRTIFDHLLKVAPPGETVAEGGNLGAGQSAAHHVVENTYLNSYVAHAPMEPHTALAKVEGNKVTIWASTQTPFALKDEAASLLGLPAQNVRVITPYVGGGFGGKSNNRQALEAVRLAKLTGKPVQVAWTRAEEFFYDTFRPAAVVKVRAGVTEAGLISFWDYGVYFAGERGSQHFYDIPNHRTVAYSGGWTGVPGSHPFATGPWRAPANNTNTFARESHIDALAAKAGIDPVEFRLKNLKDPRMRRVLEAAAKKFGWSPAKAPSGRGYGVACGTDVGTVVAHIAEVAVNKQTGSVRVKRVVCAQEMGLCVNPEGARIQMEGCITMGLGYALAEEIKFAGGKIHDSNFDTYTLPRFSWLPEIETVIVDAKESPAQGGGEPAVICMGGVLANAVFDATGARVLQLPMTPERIKAALARV
ncbi:MAG: molybdopterin-dependent oxidoreductase [Acidobacteriia bacterium]|nr:molybdopterin-dependent oxidoreductase [Terriglobia bacterium]